MADDGGRGRRRRMLLLGQHYHQPAPALYEAGAPETAEAAVPVDGEYLALCGASSRAVLCVEDASGKVLREQPLHRPFWRIGRGPDNDLRLNHDRIEAQHLLLAWLPGGLYYVALSKEAELKGPDG